MLTRRGFVGTLATGCAGAVLASRAVVAAPASGTVLLNANEYPAGPPPESLAAITRTLNETNRYHFEEFFSFHSTLGASLNLKADNILVGAGSTEVLHSAIDAFVTPTRPYIMTWPSYEEGLRLVAAKGYPTVKVPLTSDYSADVERLAREAARSGGGLIYICNPNNPTSSITRSQEIRWLAEHLPPETYLLVDEAYIHFAEPQQVESAVALVREGRNVIVARTFSKLYGMAGLRVGFVAAPAELIARITPYRSNVISIIGLRAAQAALSLGPRLIAERRAAIARTRSNLCRWCRDKRLKYIEPHANFMMIETGRDVREVITALTAKGVVPGRPFLPYDKMVRITIGADRDMEKFKSAFGELLSV